MITTQSERERISQETLALMKTVYGTELQKAGFTTAEAIEGILLEEPSKKLRPVVAPLARRIPRHMAPRGSSSVQWKAITGINTANLKAGVAEGARNTTMTFTTITKSSGFKTLAMDNAVTFEAYHRARGFEDLLATAVTEMLYSLLNEEEKTVLWGQKDDIGPPTTVTATAGSSGGSLATGTYTIKVSALTGYGCLLARVGQTAGPTDVEDETEATASSGVSVTGPTGKVDVTWTNVAGAAAYNVYVKKDSDAYKWTATIHNLSYTVTAVGTGSTPNTADQSGDANLFNGLFSQIDAAGSGATITNVAGTLTSDTAASIKEFDTLLKTLWSSKKIGPTLIVLDAEQALDVTRIIAGSSGLAYRIAIEDGRNNLIGGIAVNGYVNKFASSLTPGNPATIPILVHPWYCKSHILFLSEILPYPGSQVANAWEMEVLQEYTQRNFALTTRKYEVGVDVQETLKGYFTGGCGLLKYVQPS